MPRKIFRIVSLIFMVFSAAEPAWAGSKLLNVQGKLTNSGGTALSGNYTITFRMYNNLTDPIGNAIWSESQSVTVSSGLFNVTIGSATALDPITFNKPYYLGMQVTGDSNELSPRQLLGASAYALGALGNFNVQGNIVSSGSITAVGSVAASNITSTGSITANGTILASSFTMTSGTNPLHFCGVGITSQIGANYLNGHIDNVSYSMAAIDLNAPTSAASISLYTSPTANIAGSLVGYFSNAGDTFQGTTTNDYATAGNVGEWVRSYAGGVSETTSGVYQNFTSIYLTPGDWDVTLQWFLQVNTANFTGGANADIYINAPTAPSDVYGDNGTVFTPSSIPYTGGSISNFRTSLASAATIYATGQSVYSSGTPLWWARLSARRVR